MLCLARAMVCCAFCMDWRARSDLSASAALSLVALSAAKRCCSGVFVLVVTSITRMQLFMPNKSWFIYRICLAHINTQQVAAEENCHCKVTTEASSALHDLAPYNWTLVSQGWNI